MRTRVLLLPGALESEDDAPLFERAPPALENLFHRSKLIRIVERPSSTPESAWLGLDPARYPVEQGPLTVAAFRAEPPDRAVSFHLSILSTFDVTVQRPGYVPTAEEAELVLETARRLETSRLKIVPGHELDHALVWEDGSIELGCRTPDEVIQNGLWKSLPEGDGEPMLRRFIDDSVNLLSGLEMNRIRQEEGLPPLNLLWPWGPGFRPELPNLTVTRGASVKVESPSFRLAGLCRLVGYRHGDPWALGKGTHLSLETMAASALESPRWLGVIPTVGEFRRQGKLEEVGWMGREFAERLLKPLADETAAESRRIVLAATSRDGAGLALNFQSDGPLQEKVRPFRGELAHEKGLANRELHELMAEALTL